MNPDTDVSTAQSFDAGAFFRSLATPLTGALAQRIAPTQHTGIPSVTTTPNLRAVKPGEVPDMGFSLTPVMLAGILVFGAVAAYLLLRK